MGVIPWIEGDVNAEAVFLTETRPRHLNSALAWVGRWTSAAFTLLGDDFFPDLAILRRLSIRREKERVMPTDILRANYAVLLEAANRFGQEAERIRQVQQGKDKLRQQAGNSIP